MKNKWFRHLSSFGYAGAEVPVKKIGAFLSTRLQKEVLGDVLRESNLDGPSLQELGEPDLSKVNLSEKVRGGIETIWQPIVEEPLEIPPPQLLERLNQAWSASEKKIGEEAQSDAREIFRRRAEAKGEIIKAKAHREAVEKGIPATMRWLQGLKDESIRASKLVGQDVLKYDRRKEKQRAAIEDLKEEWHDLLTKATEISVEPQHVARKFLAMAGIVLLIGLGLWLVSIPVNSILSVAGVVIAVLVGLKMSWPLFKHLGISRKLKLVSARLASSYKSMSFFGLDEITKRLELQFYSEDLPVSIEKIIAAYRERYAALESKRGALDAQMNVLQASLHAASATVRTVVREDALEEWYTQGKLQAPRDGWISRLCSIDTQPSWEEINAEARSAFGFVQKVKVENEIFELHREKEERLRLLRCLREAAIGRTPGEALLTIDFAIAGARPMENHVIVEIANGEDSELAKEIQAAWGDAGVGLSIVPSADASAISIVGLTYGFPFGAIRDFAASLKDFEEAKKNEGDSIFPVLLPAGGAE